MEDDMGFILFKSTEDKMKEAMLFGILPEGLVVKSTVEKLLTGVSEEFSMVQYELRKMNTCPMQELIMLKEALMKLEVGLVIFEEAGTFFISRPKMLLIKDKLLPALGNADEQSSLAWVMLEKIAWLSGIPLASVKYYSEGFQVKSFIKDQKPEKIFIHRR